MLAPTFSIIFNQLQKRYQQLSIFELIQHLLIHHPQNDALFIIDEVQTGCGATGSMW
jgi:acetylornithine/succinyldiaminopimelate/putrescine aminotransferase